MKKLILSVFMFALIAGASVNSTANAPWAESSGIVAMPHLIYCLSSGDSDVRNTAAGVGASVLGGWAIKAGYGVAIVAGWTGVGLIGGLALGY